MARKSRRGRFVANKKHTSDASSQRSLRFEQLETRRLLAADFGDAPAPYPTLLADDGARHITDNSSTTLYLGAGVDSEVDGSPSITANEDDLFSAPSADEENGVFDPANDLAMNAGANPVVRVFLTNKTGGDAILYGWIDINQDGVFDNATERASVVVPSSDYIQKTALEFSAIPADSPLGETYVRLRLSTDGAAANPHGEADDGEVEDYSAYIYGLSEAALQSEDAIKIASGVYGGQDVYEGVQFGESIASIGDLDGDGVTDLAVGMRDYSAGGAVNVLFMQADGTVRESVRIASGLNGGPTVVPGDFFGWAIAGMGDLNGDGVPDIAVSAPYQQTGDAHLGSVYILLMNSDGSVHSYTSHDSSGYGPATSVDAFGSSLAILGDLDGNGAIELAIGAPKKEFLPPTNNPYFATTDGAVYILSISSDGSSVGSRFIRGPLVPFFSDGDGFGSALACIGDINGDGVSDLVIGADHVDSYSYGAVYVALLHPYGYPRELIQLDRDSLNMPVLYKYNYFGRSLAAIGDLNGDGINEVAVGIDDGFFVLSFTSSGTIASSSVLSWNDGEGPDIGFQNDWGDAIAFLGDIDGDGFGEIALGVPDDDTNGSNTGAIYIASLEPDTTGPLIESLQRSDPTEEVTNAGALQFQITFNEDVVNLDVNDLVVTGGSTAAVQSVVSINARTYNVVVEGGDLDAFNGLLGLEIAPTVDISDRAGNAIWSVQPVVDQKFLIDNLPPEIYSIERSDPLSTVTDADEVAFVVRFNELACYRNPDPRVMKV